VRVDGLCRRPENPVVILCFGTTPAVQRVLVFEQFVPGRANTAVATYEGSAGKCVNVAKVVHALGEPARLITFAGGSTGQLIGHELEEAGVPHELVAVAAPTRVCTTAVDRSRGTSTEFVEEAGSATADEWRRLLAAYARGVRLARLVVLSGTIAPGAAGDVYAECIRMAHAVGAAVIVDAQGEALRRTLALHPLVAKPNRAELAAMLHRDLSTDAALGDGVCELVRAGATWAAVTMGARGVVLSDGRGLWRIAPPALNPVNPIGSGDAFAAGLAVSLLRGTPLPQAALLGVACGASNALDPLPGRIQRPQVEDFLARLVLQNATGTTADLGCSGT
jgi:tagatose 6-phosphate kinase